MFEKRGCKVCVKKVKADWEFCPYCGNSLRGKPVPEDLEKEFRKLTGAQFPKVFMKPRGITITISSGRPGIGIKTSRRIEPEIKRKVKVKELEKIPKFTEEPETRIKRVGPKEIIQIKLPEVKSQDDIEVRRLEQSIEIRAWVGDKAYFKLIPVRPNLQISRKTFENNVLKIEMV